MSDLLKAERERAEFMAVLQDALKHRPIVPSFRIMPTKDEQEQNIESIKYQTAFQQGFDFLHQYLTGKSVSNVKEFPNGRSNGADR